MKNTKNKKASALSANSASKRFSFDVDWIPELAEPYLRGYRPQRQATGVLRGYWFFATTEGSARKGNAGATPLRSKGARGSRIGFFVGYLVKGRGWKFLQSSPPECVVFAFVLPIGGAAHEELVGDGDSLLRNTFTYIRYLTHRQPRFRFFDAETPTLIRHLPLKAWPARRVQHYARNFYIETLAWLVRSALVRKLAANP